jgi:serine/threonine-protein kinase
VAAPLKVGRYEILKTLSRGGMGSRLLARDPVLDRLVTIKPLAIDDDELSQRVVREARTVARLNHPNIETILEVGQDDGRPVMATAWNGHPLSRC